MEKLQKGAQAPKFEGVDQNAKTISLTDFKGKKLALAIYVSDGSKGCVMYLQDLQNHLSDLKKEKVEVVGLSKNSMESHLKFAEKNGFEFSLLSDPDLKIIKEYKAFGPKKTAKGMNDGVLRTTVVIDEKGEVIESIFPVDIHQAAEQILEVTGK